MTASISLLNASEGVGEPDDTCYKSSHCVAGVPPVVASGVALPAIAQYLPNALAPFDF
ncbi:hypothetical protein LC593_02445 [Nostoc sp. CHAB 5844]|nr:hypothetical protein [Nostoc sp. CHAB 5844]